MKKKLALVMATIALAVVAVGATLAWFTYTTDTVENTFTVGNIEIDINETDVDGKGAKANSYKLIPGSSYVKDPKITVEGGSENCYVYMKLIVTDNVIEEPALSEVVQYTINPDWILVPGTENVYYYKNMIPKSATDTLVDSTLFVTTSGKQIKINDALTKEMVETIDGKNADGTANTAEKTPKINIIGYAVQADNMNDAVDAWNKAFGTTTP